MRAIIEGKEEFFLGSIRCSPLQNQNKLTISAGLPEECPKAPENARKCPETVNIHGRIIIKSMSNVVGNGCAP
jgi:hypothetical protein